MVAVHGVHCAEEHARASDAPSDPPRIGHGLSFQRRGGPALTPRALNSCCTSRPRPTTCENGQQAAQPDRACQQQQCDHVYASHLCSIDALARRGHLLRRDDWCGFRCSCTRADARLRKLARSTQWSCQALESLPLRGALGGHHAYETLAMPSRTRKGQLSTDHGMRAVKMQVKLTKAAAQRSRCMGSLRAASRAKTLANSRTEGTRPMQWPRSPMHAGADSTTRTKLCGCCCSESVAAQNSSVPRCLCLRAPCQCICAHHSLSKVTLT